MVGNVLMRALVPALLIGLALYVGWSLYSRPEGDRWATVKDIHARWEKNELHLSITIDKRVECHDVVVSKYLVPLSSDAEAELVAIPLTGHLAEKIEAAPLGETDLFDVAVDGSGALKPGRYQLVLVASCEAGPGEYELDAASRLTAPVARVVVIEP